MNRRLFLQLTFGGAITFAATGQARWPQPLRIRPLPFGFNLIGWDRRALGNARLWRVAIISLHRLGVGRVTIVPYRLVDPGSLRLVDSSKFDLVAGPRVEVVAEIMQFARKYGLSVSLKPLIEIDNADGEGEVWRGSLRAGPDQLAGFFESYTGYIIDMIRIAVRNGADRFYIGSELAALATDAACRLHWLRLIETCRREIGSSRCLLSYAANYDEYRDVPFWSALDEIGIDAYFPLARRDEAAGRGLPAIDKLKQGFVKIFNELHAFSSRNNRPVMLAEWGVVPLDLSTTEPSSEEPSQSADPEEALNAYKALIEVLGEQEAWLTGVDFWHWSVSRKNDSVYGITADSSVADLIRSASRL